MATRHPDDRDPIPRSRWLVAVVVLAVAATGVTVANNRGGSEVPGSGEIVRVAPAGSVELSSLPVEHQRVYLAAAADPEAFEQVACYCGCETFLDHRHLMDCFVRPTGGWEGHATGCAVCLAEAREVLDARLRGVPIGQIVDEIDARYGRITDPTAT